MRQLWLRILAVVVLAVTVPASAQMAAPESARLIIRIVGHDGRPLNGVKAVVRGADLSNASSSSASSAMLVGLGHPARILHGGLLGLLELELSPETYDFAFTRAGYYDLELRGVRIEIPDSPLRIEELEPLRVMMHPRLDLDAEPENTQPLYLDAPSMKIAFRPTKPPIRATKARGMVTLTNTGTAPILLPVEHDFRWRPGQTLVLRIMLGVENTDIALDEHFGCRPTGGSCRRLAPGESVDVPVELRSERLYSAGLSSPALWGEAGRYEGTISAYLIHPYELEEQPTYSRRVEAPFQVSIKDWQ